MRLVSDPLISQSAADARYKTLEAVIAPTLLNGWVNTGAGDHEAGYFKSPQGMVTNQGKIQGGVASTIAYVIPAGYNPAGQMEIAAISAGGAVARVIHSPNGNFTIKEFTASVSYIYSFRAA